MGAFTSCPLAFRFSYIQRLPEPPAPAASKGTLVHLALQHLMWRPAEERTLDAALADLDRARAELAGDPEFAGLALGEEEWAGFHADAAALVRRYFDLEDPRTVRPIGLELLVEAELESGVRLRGIIDRLELDEHDELVVTDYKTGTAPREQWEAKSLAGVHVYALLCEQMFGRRPARVQLLYLSTPERIVTVSTDPSVRGVAVKSTALMSAVRTACARGDFRPRPGPLCDYCSFREFCPTFGGDPELAEPTLLGTTPPLPLAAV
jgi:putative RecB family exonuclease